MCITFILAQIVMQAELLSPEKNGTLCSRPNTSWPSLTPSIQCIWLAISSRSSGGRFSMNFNRSSVDRRS